MIFLTIVLVFFGLLLPFVSSSTGLLCWKPGTGWREGPSPIFIPIFGPLFLTLAIHLNSWPWWLIPIAWMTDLGTLVLFSFLPTILREEWKTSRFTRVLRLEGCEGNAHATLTFHASGKYLLRKEWVRPKGEEGVIAMGELGTYTEAEDGLTLRSDEQVDRSVVREGIVFLIERRLVHTAVGYVVVQETDLPERWIYHSIRR